MTEQEVFENLCVKDKRNPEFKDLYSWVDAEDIPEPRIDCYCDNCFYGRDKLALEIIQIKNQQLENKACSLYVNYKKSCMTIKKHDEELERR